VQARRGNPGFCFCFLLKNSGSPRLRLAKTCEIGACRQSLAKVNAYLIVFAREQRDRGDPVPHELHPQCKMNQCFYKQVHNRLLFLFLFLLKNSGSPRLRLAKTCNSKLYELVKRKYSYDGAEECLLCK